jgi:hypothetical protein
MYNYLTLLFTWYILPIQKIVSYVLVHFANLQYDEIGMSTSALGTVLPFAFSRRSWRMAFG